MLISRSYVISVDNERFDLISNKFQHNIVNEKSFSSNSESTLKGTI